VGFAFHVEVVIRAGEPDYAAAANAEPNEAVAQRVNVDPKCALDRLPRVEGPQCRRRRPERRRQLSYALPNRRASRATYLTVCSKPVTLRLQR